VLTSIAEVHRAGPTSKERSNVQSFLPVRNRAGPASRLARNPPVLRMPGPTMSSPLLRQTRGTRQLRWGRCERDAGGVCLCRCTMALCTGRRWPLSGHRRGGASMPLSVLLHGDLWQRCVGDRFDTTLVLSIQEFSRVPSRVRTAERSTQDGWCDAHRRKLTQWMTAILRAEIRPVTEPPTTCERHPSHHRIRSSCVGGGSQASS
jgi:hypothetical protein